MQKPLLWTVLLRSYHGSKDLGTLTIVVLLFVCSSNHWASHTIGTVNFLQQSQTTTNGHNGSFFSFIRKAEVPVNWCPALGTVLANEEVVDGVSERGGHPVIRK